MTYWHMQLHPDDINWKREEELLKKKSLIGLGLISESQINKFKKDLKQNDIVLIKRGTTPIALVEVVGDFEDNLENDMSKLDWFRYRRNIKVLDIFSETKLDISDKPTNNFPSPRTTFALAKDKNSKTYKYIQNWHKSLYPYLYKNENYLRIKSIYIQHFKIFKNFKIDFSKNDKTLQIVVIAGTNGCGKTTLLDYIENFINYSHSQDKSEIVLEEIHNQTKREILLNRNNLRDMYTKEETNISKYFRENIIYFKSDETINEIKKFMPKYLENKIYKDDIKASEVFEEVRKYINKLFNELDIKIEFDSRDGDGNLFFRNKNSKDEIFSIDDISTGEKTLVSKVLFLYLNDIKNQVILIDEPELSLHPSWQNRVLKLYESFAKDNNCQIIIATHSPHIISSSPYRYLRFLIEENGQIVSKKLTSSPLDRDINTIIKTIMGADVIPKELRELHNKYRQLFEDGKIDSDEAKELKNKILEYESINSSFFQGIKFDMELMG